MARKGQFQKGDSRINRKGRPRKFDALRALAIQIGTEEIAGQGITVVEAILRKLAYSKNPADQKLFLEIAYGKVPDEVNLQTDNPLQLVITERKTRGPDDSA